MAARIDRFNLCDYFLGDKRLEVIGERTAIEFAGRSLSYRTLKLLTGCWAARLRDHGVAAGDRVALLLFDSAEFVACFLAAASVGAVSVPINTFLNPEDVAFVLSDSGSRLLIVEEALSDKLRLVLDGDGLDIVAVKTEREAYDRLSEPFATGPAVAASTAETPCFLLYTSGSTGKPKGVLHLHGSIPHTVASYGASVLRLTPEDRVYSSSRLFFAYGLGNSLSFPLASGAAVILDPSRATAERIADILDTESPTAFFAVPAVYNALLELHARVGGLNTSSLRLCVSAGEALPSRVFEEWEKAFNLTILDGIGSTEMLHIFMSNRDGAARSGSSGTPVDGYAVRLLGDDGESVSDNEPGNLWVRGPSAFAEYWNQSVLTQRAVVDGWVRTGDLYRVDADGFYYHVGRSDDCFKVRGLWVSPIEVETALLTHESVAEAAVVPSVDSSGLATVRAFVVIRHEEAGERLRAQLREVVGAKLPQYKVPSSIEFIDAMPRTSTGKVQRYKLRDVGV